MPVPRLLLAIETSGRAGSVAIVGDSGVYAERPLPPGQRTAQTLAPAIQSALAEAQVSAKELTAVAVATGPGSFTGLRIGVTAAKTLAFATGCRLVGVNTLDVLAAQATLVSARRVWSIIDAQRGDLFAACYAAPVEMAGVATDPTQLMSAEDWLTKLSAGDLVIGPAVGRVAERLPTGIYLAEEKENQPHAATVGRLGLRLLDAGRTVDPFQLVPQYHRLSAAEEKAARE